jgi:hypothetical protein
MWFVHNNETTIIYCEKLEPKKIWAGASPFILTLCSILLLEQKHHFATTK